MKRATLPIVLALIAAASTSSRSHVDAQAAPVPAQETVEVALSGELEVEYEDSVSGSRLNHFLRTDDGRRLRLQFSESPGLLTGARIRARGRLINGTLMLTSGTSVQTTAPLASPNTFGAQSTIVILVNFQDNPSAQPYTPASATDTTFVSSNNF